MAEERKKDTTGKLDSPGFAKERDAHYRFQGELESDLSDLGTRINPGNQKMTI